LCKEIPSNSIEKLRKAKCHGPIGYVIVVFFLYIANIFFPIYNLSVNDSHLYLCSEKFSHQKLKEKGGSEEEGLAILRQSSRCYGTYKLDVTTKANCSETEGEYGVCVETFTIRETSKKVSGMNFEKLIS